MDNTIPQVTVPDGERGEWRVSKFTVTEAQSKFDALRGAIKGHGRFCRPGTFTSLSRNGYLVMSDTDNERRDHLAPIYFFRPGSDFVPGRLLLSGLGLGMILNAALLRPDLFAFMEVVERERDVIDLVHPHYLKTFGPDRFVIHHADIFEWRLPKEARWDYAWHDIWPDLCTDYLPEMTRLKRKFSRRIRSQGCWSQHLLLGAKRRGW